MEENTFANGDELNITAIQSPKLFLKRAQAKIDSVSSITRVITITFDDENEETTTTDTSEIVWFFL